MINKYLRQREFLRQFVKGDELNLLDLDSDSDHGLCDGRPSTLEEPTRPWKI